MKWKLNRRKLNKKNSLLAALVILALLASLLSTAGVTVAKYVSSKENTGAAVAKPFYFTSDKLEEDMPYYQLEEPAAGENIILTFTLSNFVDDLRRTDTQIDYSYCAYSGSAVSGTGISGTSGTGSISGNGFNTTPEITMTFRTSDFGSDGMVTVVATAGSPYEKAIGARFGFTAGENKVVYNVTSQGNAVVLTFAGGAGEQVSIAWPQELSPDLTNPVFQGVSGHSLSFIPESGKRYALTFLKTDPTAEYTKESFTIS